MCNSKIQSCRVINNTSSNDANKLGRFQCDHFRTKVNIRNLVRGNIFCSLFRNNSDRYNPVLLYIEYHDTT